MILQYTQKWMARMISIHIIALGALGGGLSGGDRIFIEFARRWSEKLPVHIYVWEEGLLMCQRERLAGKYLNIHLVRVGKLSKLGFIFIYFYRIFLGLKLGLTLKLKNGDFVYSASEFWMDSLPAFILKLRNKKRIEWLSAWLQTAPNPIRGFSESKRKRHYRFYAFLYWIIQKSVKPLIANFANFILINNDEEKKQFPLMEKENKLIVVLSAVNLEAISKYLKTHKSPKTKKYLAVFQGRFHFQKGVVELIDIWWLVTQNIPSAKLAMIGNGPLMKKVESKIKELHLENNVEVFGFLHDGDKKFSIFQRSKIVVHPSFYDSGGISPREAMAFGLPCVGFNLKSYASYYQKGMLKVPIGDLNAFSEKIIDLNSNRLLYNSVSKDAGLTISSDFSWEKRAREVLEAIKT